MISLNSNWTCSQAFEWIKKPFKGGTERFQQNDSVHRGFPPMWYRFDVGYLTVISLISMSADPGTTIRVRGEAECQGRGIPKSVQILGQVAQFEQIY